MRPITKFVIVVAILLVTFGLPVLLEKVINPVPPISSTPTPSITVTVAIDDIRFLSIPPVIVTANTTFLYKMVTASLSGEKVTISVLSKPAWMEWDEDMQQLKGTIPAVGGVFSVTMQATTLGGASADQTFTVTIEESQAVKGATTIALWKDPFHPNLSEIRTNEQLLIPDVPSEDALAQGAVLGESTTNRSIPPKIMYFGVVGIAVLLVVAIIVLVAKIIKVLSLSKSRESAGVIIERGQR